MFSTIISHVKKTTLLFSIVALLTMGWFFYHTTEAHAALTLADIQAMDIASADIGTLEEIVQFLAQTLDNLLAEGNNTTAPTTGDLCTYAQGITESLNEGDTHEQVKILQKFLNNAGTPVALLGDGSLGYETNYFGTRTEQAVQKWQDTNGVDTTNGGSGEVGSRTRARMVEVACGGVTTPAPATRACTMEARMCPNGQMMPRDPDCTWRADQCSSSIRTATITSSPTAELNTEKTFTGTAYNLTKVRLVFTKPSGASVSTTTNVINGIWSKSIRGSQFAVSGDYLLTVQGSAGVVLAQQTVVVAQLPVETIYNCDGVVSHEPCAVGQVPTTVPVATLGTMTYRTNSGGGSFTGISREKALQWCDSEYNAFSTKPSYMVCGWISQQTQVYEEIKRFGTVPTSFVPYNPNNSSRMLYGATITADGVAIANGGTITIPENSKVNFGWNSNGGTSCTLTGLKGNVSSSGSIYVDKTNVGSYVFICNGMNAFAFDIKSKGTISADGSPITTGGTITIPENSKVLFKWDSNGGTSCKLTGLEGNVSSSGSVYIDKTDVGSYIFSCTNMNPFAFTVVAQASGVVPPTTSVNATITADGVAIANGGTITIPENSKVNFGWNSNGGTSCTLTGLKGNVSSSGSIYVDKTNVGSYVFICNGMNAFAFDIKSKGTISADGSPITTGGTITIPENSKVLFKWDSNGGTSCKLTGLEGNVSSSGSVYIDKTDVGSYVFSCTNMNPFAFTVVAQASTPAVVAVPVVTLTYTPQGGAAQNITNGSSFPVTSTGGMLGWRIVGNLTTCKFNGADFPSSGSTAITSLNASVVPYTISCTGMSDFKFTVAAQASTPTPATQTPSPTATITSSNSASAGVAKVISGIASNLSKVDIKVTNTVSGASMGTNDVPLVNGMWTYTFGGFSAGTYTVTVSTKSSTGSVIPLHSTTLNVTSAIVSTPAVVAAPVVTLTYTPYGKPLQSIGNGGIVYVTSSVGKLAWGISGNLTTCKFNGNPLAPSGSIDITTAHISSNVITCPGMSDFKFTVVAQTAFNSLNAQPFVTGIFSQNTSATLTEDLYRGTTGAQVTQLQQVLAKEGFFTEEITGNFYDATLEAVRAFQIKYGINATGYVGAATRAVLNAR